MRAQKAASPLLLLLAILITACTNAVEFAGTDDQALGTTPDEAAINAAANQAAEEATAVDEPPATNDQPPATSDQPPAPKINRRVEILEDLPVAWLIPWDGIRPIYDPEFVPAGNAPLEDDELIIGVAWDGEAKAYPISVLRSREMVNDELAGIPTLVTW